MEQELNQGLDLSSSQPEKKSAVGNFLAKCVIWISVAATIMIIYWSVKMFVVGNTFR
ncbi:MAG: hypothetical protein JSS63_03135 [Bacteroidetes bacterium]|nr:hypothetical protein [Bacteroidota bacterium]MBX7047084.1 hypothetical protein [Ignavibacteria bacterium]